MTVGFVVVVVVVVVATAGRAVLLETKAQAPVAMIPLIKAILGQDYHDPMRFLGAREVADIVCSRIARPIDRYPCICSGEFPGEFYACCCVAKHHCVSVVPV